MSDQKQKKNKKTIQHFSQKFYYSHNQQKSIFDELLFQYVLIIAFDLTVAIPFVDWQSWNGETRVKQTQVQALYGRKVTMFNHYEMVLA